jgi:hypothetical protein
MAASPAEIGTVITQAAAIFSKAVRLTSSCRYTRFRLLRSFLLRSALAECAFSCARECFCNVFVDVHDYHSVQRQLNKGEYQHKLPSWIFFADQGEFTTGDYEEIMNKASSLSFVSNAILYWNTLKINDIVEKLKKQGEDIDDETLSHISLLPYKHVLPNATYFIGD